MSANALIKTRHRTLILILEATIAILIVTGALLAVYSQQVDRRVDLVDYYNDLQGQILADISDRSDLRLNVLNVEEEDFGDGNFVTLNNFIEGKIPDGFGYSIRVCELGSKTDFCKMRAPIFIATMDEDIYVEEIVVSSELGNGTNAVYNPKKLKLFVWEGESVEMDCENECSVEGVVYSCSADGRNVLKNICGNFDNDFCLERGGAGEVFETCVGGKECIDGLGICAEPSGYSELTCKKKTITETGCVGNYDDECDDHDGGGKAGDHCSWPWDTSYECWDTETLSSGCLENPVCPCGTGCVKSSCSSAPPGCTPTSWTPSPGTRCIGETFTQISNCGGTRSAVGTKNCVPAVASLSASIDMMSTATLWDSAYSCYYNKCIYQVSVSNTGDVSGVVWKRVGIGSDGGSFEKIYNKKISSGTVNLVLDQEGFGASECDIDKSYNVNIYDDSGNIIGGKSFTCSHP